MSFVCPGRQLLGEATHEGRKEGVIVDHAVSLQKEVLSLTVSFTFFLSTVDAFVALRPPTVASASAPATTSNTQLHQQLNYDPFRMMPEEVSLFCRVSS